MKEKTKIETKDGDMMISEEVITTFETLGIETDLLTKDDVRGIINRFREIEKLLHETLKPMGWDGSKCLTKEQFEKAEERLKEFGEEMVKRCLEHTT